MYVCISDFPDRMFRLLMYIHDQSVLSAAKHSLSDSAPTLLDLHILIAAATSVLLTHHLALADRNAHR